MVARYTDRIVVMEKGSIVEAGTTEQILELPQHPYTRKLLSSLPVRGEVRPIDMTSAPMISARNIVVDYPGRNRFSKGRAKTRTARCLA